MDKQVQVTRRTKDCEYNRWLILDDPFFYMFFVGLNAWKSTGGKIQSTAFITQSSELLCFIFEACDNWVVMHYQNRKKSDKLSMWMENLTWEGQMMVGGCWVFSRLYYMYFNPFCSNFGSNFNKKKVLISFGVLPHVLNTHTGSHMQRITWVIRQNAFSWFPINSVYLRYLEVLLMVQKPCTTWDL